MRSVNSLGFGPRFLRAREGSARYSGVSSASGPASSYTARYRGLPSTERKRDAEINPGHRIRSATCSSSYQRLNSASSSPGSTSIRVTSTVRLRSLTWCHLTLCDVETRSTLIHHRMTSLSYEERAMVTTGVLLGRVSGDERWR